MINTLQANPSWSTLVSRGCGSRSYGGLSSGLAWVFMANTVSLLPGTISTDIGEACLVVHVLDGRKDVFSELNAVEQRVARLFGISLVMPGGIR